MIAAGQRSEFDFDVIVAGSGAGGGTLAAACANAGHSVLLVERGGPADLLQTGRTDAPRHDERAMLIDKQPYDDRLIELNGRDTRLLMGGLIGGGTSVYGAALIRPQAGDFSPGRFYGSRLPAEIQHWPVSFESFEPWFQKAEQLYHVADRPDSGVNAVTPPSTSPGLPLARINDQLMQAASTAGLNPWRLPLAIDAATCLRCDHCAGFLCPTGARRSSAQLVQESLRRGTALQVLPHCEVELLQRGLKARSPLNGVRVRFRSDGTTQTFRARRYVLAAGAIGSPALLLKSGFDHAHIGRNYMLHYSPVAVGLFAGSTEADISFVKQVGLSDYYYGTPELPEKMGIIQSLPAPGPLMLARSGLRFVPAPALNWLRARMLPLVGIIEDLPHPDNRVTLNDSGGIRLRHSYSEYDHLRGRALGARMAQLLKSAGAWHCVSGKLPDREHVGHQCGTLRFGTARRHAPADPECRLYDQPDVFVADGSFMPSSLGVGPSLTIIANALRVAEVVMSEL